MGNQYASDPYSLSMGDPRTAPMGQGVNAGMALPNLDPKKKPTLDPMTYMASRTSAAQMAGGPQTPMPQPTPAQPQAPSQQVYGTFYGAQGRQDAPVPLTADDQQFEQRGRDLQARSSGQRTSAQISNDAAYEEQQHEQARQGALRMLAGRGFAPSSALGLQYERDTDRQVAELMERRRFDAEQAAQQDYGQWLDQSNQRANTRADQAFRTRQADESQRQFAQTEADKKRAREWWRPENWFGGEAPVPAIAGAAARAYVGGTAKAGK